MPTTKNQLLQDTVARPMLGGRWALMNKQETGLASSAIHYGSLSAICAAWDVQIGEFGEDEFGTFVRIHRAKPGVPLCRACGPSAWPADAIDATGQPCSRCTAQAVYLVPSPEAFQLYAAIGVDGSDRKVLGVGDSRELAEESACDYVREHRFALVMRVVPMTQEQLARWATGTRDPVELGLLGAS